MMNGIFLIVALFVYNLVNNVKSVSKTVHNLPGCKGTYAAQLWSPIII